MVKTMARRDIRGLIMKDKLRLIALVLGFYLMIMIFFTGVTSAFYSEYAGSISNNLLAPTSIHVSDDQIAVLEPFKKQLTVFTPDGALTNVVDLDNNALGLARLGNNGYLICDTESNALVWVDIFNGLQTQLISNNDLDKPTDVLVKNSIIYILDAGTNKIIRVNEIGIIENRFSLHYPNGTIGYASSFVYSQTTNQFYILDQLNSNIKVFSPAGDFMFEFGTFGQSDGELTRGGELVSDSYGNIYVSDRFQGRVSVFDKDGEFLTNLVLTDYNVEGFSVPTGIGFDSQGFLYVSATETGKIHIIYVDPQGSPNRILSADLAYPEDNAVLNQDNVYMMAYVGQNPERNDVTGFDFQLFDISIPDEPIAEVVNIDPIVEQESGAIYSEWYPDTELTEDQTYSWRVRVNSDNFSGEWSVERQFSITALPKKFSLEQNYPNPFNPATRIAFELPKATKVSLIIYSALGQEVAKMNFENLPAGRHEVIWKGKSSSEQPVSSGVYFYRLIAGEFNKTKKMVLLK
jgi:hypothetical protein